MTKVNIWYETDPYDETVLKNVTSTQNEYVIPSTITKIADGTIDNYAFQLVKNTKFSISFEENSQLDTIGKYSCCYCVNLINIDFTNAVNLKYIEYYAFAFCKSLTSVSFPKNLKELRNFGTFYECRNLREVVFPSNSQLEIISDGTFSYTALSTIEIPEKCHTIFGSSFESSPIEYFTVHEGN